MQLLCFFFLGEEYALGILEGRALLGVVPSTAQGPTPTSGVLCSVEGAEWDQAPGSRSSHQDLAALISQGPVIYTLSLLIL